ELVLPQVEVRRRRGFREPRRPSSTAVPPAPGTQREQQADGEPHVDPRRRDGDQHERVHGIPPSRRFGHRTLCPQVPVGCRAQTGSGSNPIGVWSALEQRGPGRDAMAHSVLHFELNGPQPEAAGSFYAELFGWHTQTIPGGYVVIDTHGGRGI